MRIYNLKYKQEYLEEIAILTQKEWGTKSISENDFKIKINNKIKKNERSIK